MKMSTTYYFPVLKFSDIYYLNLLFYILSAPILLGMTLPIYQYMLSLPLFSDGHMLPEFPPSKFPLSLTAFPSYSF